MSFQAFLSHDWGRDEQGRDNHDRVRQINAALQAHQITTWFDEEKMCGDVNDAMADGIKQSETMIIFITANYLTKVSGKGEKGLDDNCRFEFKLGLSTLGVARMIPVIMEPSQTNDTQWPGVVAGKLGGTLYVNLSDTSSSSQASGVEQIVREIRARLGAEPRPQPQIPTLQRANTKRILEQGISMRIECAPYASTLNLGDRGTLTLQPDHVGIGMFGPIFKATLSGQTTAREVVWADEARGRPVAAKRMGKQHVNNCLIWRETGEGQGAADEDEWVQHMYAESLDSPFDEMRVF